MTDEMKTAKHLLAVARAAGAGGVAGSPTPVGGASLSTMATITSGASFMRSTG